MRLFRATMQGPEGCPSGPFFSLSFLALLRIEEATRSRTSPVEFIENFQYGFSSLRKVTVILVTPEPVDLISAASRSKSKSAACRTMRW